jgi:hypothetical protein
MWIGCWKCLIIYRDLFLLGAETPSFVTKGVTCLVPLYNLKYLKEELRHNFFPNILFKFKTIIIIFWAKYYKF